jgi:tight adherence protein B
MDLIFIYAVVFLGGLLLFERVIGVAAGKVQRTRAVNYRLQMLEKAEDHLVAYKGMVRQRALDYDRGGLRPLVWLRRLFAQSGLRIDIPRFAIYGLAAAIFLWFLLAFLGVPLLIRVGAVAILLAVAALFVVSRIRSRRIIAFTGQLPGAIDVINRSLSSGHPLPTAISLVSRELPDPIGSEFGMLSDELTYGTDLGDAMQNMVERTGAEEVKLLAMSMTVQRGTGGNLIEVLENLATVIRDRAMLAAKVKALSAEGRMTGIVMSLFPFGLYFMINALSPSYFDPVWASGYGNIVVAVAFCVMAVGNIVIYKMVHFDF